MKTTNSGNLRALAVTACSLIVISDTGAAPSVFTVNNTTADAFLATGSAANPVGSDLTGQNFGGAGTLAIAPAGSPKGQFDSVIKFNFTGAASQFNGEFGAGNWALSSVTLRLASNFGVQGDQPNNGIFNTINAGQFAIDHLTSDSWVEGNSGGMGSPGFPNNSSVSFNSIPTIYSGGSDPLGTFTYTPPGNNVYVSYDLPLDSSLLADIKGGGDASLYFYAADTQIGYLFNSRSFAQNHPELVLTAIPEPMAAVWTAIVLGAFAAWRRFRKA